NGQYSNGWPKIQSKPAGADARIRAGGGGPRCRRILAAIRPRESRVGRAVGLWYRLHLGMEAEDVVTSFTTTARRTRRKARTLRRPQSSAFHRTLWSLCRRGSVKCYSLGI